MPKVVNGAPEFIKRSNDPGRRKNAIRMPSDDELKGMDEVNQNFWALMKTWQDEGADILDVEIQRQAITVARRMSGGSGRKKGPGQSRFVGPTVRHRTRTR